MDYPVLDAHVHAFGPDLNCVHELMALERGFGYDSCCFLSCECFPEGGSAQNALGLYLKLLFPNCYAFGSLEYRSGIEPAVQARQLMTCGFDGIKMIEQKPTVRRDLKIALNDPRYFPFYAYLEEQQISLLAHVADPEEFWNPDLIPIWAKEAGYDYSGGEYPAKEQLYDEVEDVLNRFPRLPVILAHLFFLSADLPRLDALLHRHPNVSLDIVSGTEMYFNFTRDPAAWRAFFLRYADRIIYGTDNCNMNSAEELENARITNRFQLGFLTTDACIPAWDKHVQGIALPDDACRKILGGNFRRLAGNAPRTLNRSAAIRFLESRLTNPAFQLTESERRTSEQVLQLLMEDLCG